MKTYSLGIDIGYSSVKVAIIDNDNKLIFNQYKKHKGKVNETLDLIINKINSKFDTSGITHGAITGNLSKQITDGIEISHVNEVSAAIEGAKYLYPTAKSIIEIGGQSANYITGFNSQRTQTPGISGNSMLKIGSNSDCAAGTGSFIEEQASRLNIKVEEYSSYARKAKSIPRIAGRCSVFAKTDIVHHQQEGVPPPDILKGVAYSIVKNYKSSVIRRLPIEPPVIFIGGVAKNLVIVDALRDILQKTKTEIIVPDHFDVTNSVGAALIAIHDDLKLDYHNISPGLKAIKQSYSLNYDNKELPPLSVIEPEDITKKHDTLPVKPISSVKKCYLGIDIGSTSTNLVIINPDGEVINYKYLRTRGNPLKTVREGLVKIKTESGNNLKISGVGVTGSGRHLIGKHIGADIIKDEITAQAKAAVTIDPKVDTIFEIGGQDSKYISIKNGVVNNFQMNRVCAAGTGSFLEEQAQKFNIAIDELGKLAIKGEHPVTLGERCTVFIESAIAYSLSSGNKIEDIISGLCYSIAKNYLHRVVGQNKIGNRIFLQGGIAFNPGVANALKILLKREIRIPDFFSVTGAYGAAILALEEMKGNKSKFKGFAEVGRQGLHNTEVIKKYEPSETNKYHTHTEKMIFEDYECNIDPDKKTVGIPRSLFSFSMFPMYYSFFKALELNVILSDWSNENSINLGQEQSHEETCIPMKLVTGHVAELVNKHVDYIFFPDIYNVKKLNSNPRMVFGCAYMQQASKIIEISMELKKKGIVLLSPVLAFEPDREFMKRPFIELGRQLNKTEDKVSIALRKGMEAGQRFEAKIRERRLSIEDRINNDNISFVIISKMYGVSDPVLNMGIPDKLMDMGYQVIPFYELPQYDITNDYPGMNWSFGQSILSAAYFVRNNANMYAVFLTHHGCGPDSALSHYFREIMGDKPYLNIETDEHASKIGVITRVEAFVNSLKNKSPETKLNLVSNNPIFKKHVSNQRLSQLPENTKVYIPYLYPYSDLFQEISIQNGFEIEVLPQTNIKTINTGRKYTLTNEYYSMTSLLGDCFDKLENRSGNENTAFFIPQTEGTEIDAQYHRLLRTKLDEENFFGVYVVAPFLEDILKMDKRDSAMIFRCLIAGDIIRIAPSHQREKHLQQMKSLVQKGTFNIENLCLLARDLYSLIKGTEYRKRILAAGEPMIVFNDFLNDYTFKYLEIQKHRVVYYSFAEAIWMHLNDFINQNGRTNVVFNNILSDFKDEILAISKELKEESPYANSPEELVQYADSTIGLYTGAFGRYRHAKAQNPPANTDAVITVNSTYENTGINLNILSKGISDKRDTPVLNLSFDGNNNQNNKKRLESFIYYL